MADTGTRVKITQYAPRVRQPTAEGVPMAFAKAADGQPTDYSRAAAPLAQGLGDLASAFARKAGEDAKAWSSSTVSQARLDWSQQLVQRQADAEPGAPEFTPKFIEDFDKYAKETLDKAPSDMARRFTTERFNDIRATLGAQAAHFEANANIDWRDDQFRSAADSASKLMNTDPSQYKSALGELLATIDASNLPPVKKSARREATVNAVSGAAVWSQIQRSPTEFLRSIGFYSTDGAVKPGQFETRLNAEQEKGFQQWKKQYAPNDSGADYDLRGAYVAGMKPGEDGHWPDTFKKPNHPTFSDESKYAGYGNPGSWGGPNKDQFVPSKTRRSSGDINGMTGNLPFDALPFQQRTVALEQAIKLKNQIDLDGDRGVAATGKKAADDAMKDAWDSHFSGTLRLEDVQRIKPIIAENDYKALREAIRRGPDAKAQTDPGTLRTIMGLIDGGQYDEARRATYAGHKSGLLKNEGSDGLTGILSDIGNRQRQGGPKTEYERMRGYIVGNMDPGPLVQDPLGRSRMAEALDTFDRWVNTLGPDNKKHTDQEIEARGREIVNQYKFVDLRDTVMALPMPRGTTIRRQMQDPAAMEKDIISAGLKLQADRDARKISGAEYEQELATLNRWRKTADGLKQTQVKK